MKLYIKQKVLSLNELFWVKDEKGNDIYSVTGSFLKIPKSFYIKDTKDNVVATIDRQMFQLFGVYDIQAKGETIRVLRNFGFLRKSFAIDGIDWHLQGDLFSHEYDITRGNRIIMSLRKRWFTWGDTYELDILDEENALLALAISICVDYEIKKSESN